MDYEKKKEEYKDTVKGEKYYFKIEQKIEDQQRGKPLPSITEMIEKIPKDGSVVAAAGFHENMVIFSSLDTHLYAVDKKTGKPIWKFRTNGPIVSSPLVHKNRIYTGSCDGNFYCLDSRGSLIWRRVTGNPIVSSAAGIGDKILIGNGGGYLFCYSTDGEEIWRFRTGDGIMAVPTAVNDLLFIGSYDRSLYALDEEGKLKWKFTAGERIDSPLVMSGKSTIFSYLNRSCKKIPSCNEPGLYSGSYDNNLYSFSLYGDVIWKSNCGTSVIEYACGGHGKIYLGTASNRIYAIDAFDGSHKWSFLPGGLVASGGCVFGGNIHFGSLDQKVYCLSSEGEKIWDFLTGGMVVAAPVIQEGRLFFGSADTRFYCLNIKKRSVEWTFQAGFGQSGYFESAATEIVNAFVEHDRKVIKVWKPETSKIADGRVPNMQGYSSKNFPADFGFETGSYVAMKNPYMSKKKYISGRSPYGK